MENTMENTMKMLNYMAKRNVIESMTKPIIEEFKDCRFATVNISELSDEDYEPLRVFFRFHD